jgi:arylformamidase
MARFPPSVNPMPRYHDISLPIRAGGIVYPGNPEIRIELQQALARGDGANVSSIALGSHTATHVDAAKHFLDDGQTVDRIPLERLIGPARVVEVGDDVKSITKADLAGHDLGNSKRVLLKTRNSMLWSRGEFVRDYTYLAPDGAEYLVSLGVEVVGIDYLSIEQFRSGHHRTHRMLLEREVVIIEGLALGDVAPGTYEMICLPLRLEGLDGAPARVILIG